MTRAVNAKNPNAMSPLQSREKTSRHETISKEILAYKRKSLILAIY